MAALMDGRPALLKIEASMRSSTVTLVLDDDDDDTYSNSNDNCFSTSCTIIPTALSTSAMVSFGNMMSY